MSAAIHLPVGRVAAALAVLVGALVIAQSVRLPRWHEVAPGVEFATLNGEPYCRAGSSTLAVLRLDPERVRLRALHYLKHSERKPMSVVEWQRRTGALAVFNAGQYYSDYSYMGLFISDGDVVSPRLHPGFRGALVSEPVTRDSGGGAAHGKTARARIVDLATEPLDPKRPGWREVAQSFMLFDREGDPRVRKSDQVAARTVVGEDRHGRIVVVTSEGGYTLWEFAHLLREARLDLSHAMSMDGGHEAQLCVRTPTFRYASFGRWERDADAAAAADAQVPLPAVIAVTAR